MAVWSPRANDIFATALEQPSLERGAYLEQACGADTDLRRQGEALLAAHAQAGSFLAQPFADGWDVPTGPPIPDSGPPLPAGAEVVRALGAGVPRVQLREPDGAVPDDIRLTPQTEAELPERYRMDGEIA